MVDIKKILFPVDFTQSSYKIVPHVKYMVEKTGAHLNIIHVVRGAGDFVGFEMGTAWYSSFEDDILKGGQSAMNRFLEEKMADIKDVEPTVIVGDIVDEILKHAEKTGTDMIIMGTHGKKGLEEIMFGSVARGVIKGAGCPVLTVNPFKIGS